MQDRQRSIALYIVTLWAAGILLFLMALPIDGSAHLLDYIAFLALAALSETWFVTTSRDTGMSLSFTVHFAAVLLFGPAFACLIAVGGILIGDGIIKRRPAIRTAFNMAQMSLAVMVAGLAFTVWSVPGRLDLVRDAPALALAAFAYLVINDTLVSLVVSFTGSSFAQEWIGSFRDLMLPYVSMAPLGAVAAFCYQSAPWSILYFLPLTLVIYNGFKLFVTLQHETDHALVALADSIDKRDQYTYQHSQRVAALAGQIAATMGIQPRDADLIVAAARVHDLGKIATDNRVLFKQSSLTPDERRLIEAHPGEGGELAGKFSMFRQGRRFIRHHHERWDGKGYPDGLAGTDIPLGARIIAVADSYDAMTSDRPYRHALPHEIALIELARGAGKQFDPQIVDAFVATLKDSPSSVPQPALRALPQESCSYS